MSNVFPPHVLQPKQAESNTRGYYCSPRVTDYFQWQSDNLSVAKFVPGVCLDLDSEVAYDIPLGGCNSVCLSVRFCGTRPGCPSTRGKTVWATTG